MLGGRPLYDTSPDRRLFVAPVEWDVVLRAITRRNNVLVSAARGWGKTSLLRQIQLTLRDDGTSVAFVDATAVEEPLELLQRVRLALRGTRSAPEELRDQVQAVGAVLTGSADPPPAGASHAVLSEVRQIEGLPGHTILLDASYSAAAVYGLFGRLRDLMWQLPHRWVVAVDRDDESAVLKPPADVFYDIVLRLEPWRVDDLVRVLGKRLGPGEMEPVAVEEIAAASNGNPRAAIRAANEAVVTGRAPSASLAERAALVRRAGEVGRPHAQLMAQLLDLGQASPSDSALLQRLGLSRARVTTLLRELLSHGLVESAPDADPATSGRPRTIYRPRIAAGVR